jgi:hypothetical protein
MKVATNERQHGKVLFLEKQWKKWDMSLKRMKSLK